MKFIFSPEIEKKLRAKHSVTKEEVEQCFFNRQGGLLEDDRADNKTDPPTQWFISKTDKKRKLQVVFILKGDKVIIKTAFEPSEGRIRLYKKMASG